MTTRPGGFGPLLGFLSGWTSFTIGFSAAIALGSASTALFLVELLPEGFQLRNATTLALFLLWMLTAVHVRGVESGGRVQNLLTLLKVGGIGLLITGALVFGRGSWSSFSALALAAVLVLRIREPELSASGAVARWRILGAMGFPSWILALLAFVALLLDGGPVRSQEPTSASYRLRGGNLNGGGAVMHGAEGPSSFGSLLASIGQSEATAFSGSRVDLSSDAAGMWPIVAGVLPNLDIDGDVIQSFRDNCPFVFNPLQADFAGIGEPPLSDGIGDSCQCGDVNDDGIVNLLDIDDYRDFLADPDGMSLAPEGENKCTVIGAQSDCDVLDISVIRRVLEGPDLPPPIAQVCKAALPPP